MIATVKNNGPMSAYIHNETNNKVVHLDPFILTIIITNKHELQTVDSRYSPERVKWYVHRIQSGAR